MVKKIAVYSFCILAASVQALRADLTTVNFDSGNNGNANVFDQNTGASNPLFGGTTADGNGDVLQLGYYSSATVANPFAGTFVALSGETSLNTAVIPGGPSVNPSGETYNHTSIGDLNLLGVAQNGTFAIGLDFTLGSATSGNSLPAAGTPLSIRFFNGTTIAGSTFYNSVSNISANWLWQSPAAPPVNPVLNISLDNTGLQWLSIALGGAANTAFHTTITAIPEPSTIASLIFGGSALVFARVRRRSKR